MAQLAEPRTRRWTRAEYYRMGEIGLFHGQRVELIEGEIIEMSPQGGPHFQSIDLAAQALAAAFGPGHWVRQQGPLDLGVESQPEPDLAVVPGTARNYPNHPVSALLVVEISDSSLSYDRLHKASLCAKAGIADYSIVDLNDHWLEVYRSPVPDADQPDGFGYADVSVFSEPDVVSPLAAPQASVLVRDLLP